MTCIKCGQPCGTHAPEPVCWRCKESMADEPLPEEEFEILSGEWVEQQIIEITQKYRRALKIQEG